MSLEPIDYYDGKKWNIDEVRPILQREKKAIKIINKFTKKFTNKTILDIGCGDGQFLEELHKSRKEANLIGLDYSKYKLKKAKLRLPFEFNQCNLEDGIPLQESSISVAYSGEVIEHIYNPDLMLDEIYRVLKKNGLLVISTPNLQAWYNRILFLFGIQPLFYETSTKSSLIGSGLLKRIKKGNIPVGHLRVFNVTALKDIVQSSGFEVIEVHGAIFHSLPKPVQLIDRLFNIYPRLSSNLIIVARKT